MSVPRPAAHTVCIAVLLALAIGCASPAPRIDLSPSEETRIAAVLATSCAPCHALPRADPWYARMAPSSWFTDGARGALDLSDWDAWDPARRSAVRTAIAASVRSGRMPPADYTFFNRGAALDDAARLAVVRWATASDTH